MISHLCVTLVVMKKTSLIKAAILSLIPVFIGINLSAQTEVMAWSNISGVRVDGELIDFESSIRVGTIGGQMYATAKERQNTPKYHRDGATQQVITPLLKNLVFEQNVTDLGRGHVSIKIDAKSDTTLKQPSYFCLTFTPDHYAGAKVKTASRSLSVVSSTRNVRLSWNKSAKTSVQYDDNGDILVYVRLAASQQKGTAYSMKFDLFADGTVDNSDANIEIDAAHPGNLFAGFGGNFRIQNPGTDPMVIDYCLDNMRVAFGRVEMPWRYWDENENVDPLEYFETHELPVQIVRAAEMARRLKEIGMPLVVSCWFPPAWTSNRTTRSDGSSVAFSLKPEKKERIFRSLASYLMLLKNRYGVEADYFSFNESDLGIDVVHTPEEHCTFIKEFGKYLADNGLKTLMLLGDNSDANTFDFILPALNDPQARRYIGAVSFHSWRGCDDATLRKWAGAARKINAPLLVAEGSTDAAAWRYPEIFGESTFALYEINLYTRICAITQPISILQWQLTADYSPFFGMGIFKTEGPLRPTQRYWNLKQLSETPADAFSLPFENDNANVNPAVFGNIARGEYAVHMVNNGAARKANLSGFPASVKKVKIYTTNTVDCMSETEAEVVDGKVSVSLPPISYVTVISKLN